MSVIEREPLFVVTPAAVFDKVTAEHDADAVLMSVPLIVMVPDAFSVPVFMTEPSMVKGVFAVRTPAERITDSMPVPIVYDGSVKEVPIRIISPEAGTEAETDQTPPAGSSKIV
jgi:hypothetical protein